LLLSEHKPSYIFQLCGQGCHINRSEFRIFPGRDMSFFIFWANSSNHCLAALDLAADVKQTFDYLIAQNRQAVQFMRRGWPFWRTTWSTVCSFAPHSQAAELAIPHLYKQERKRPTPVRRRLSRTQAVLGRFAPGCVGAGVGDESTESCRVVRPLCLPLVIRPVCRTYVVVVKWTDEFLCGEHKWVSRFETPCIRTRWTGERWVEQMSRLHGDGTAC